jgi:copper transport protein
LRATLVAVGCALLLLASAGSASAHAYLIKSTPRLGADVGAAPRQLTLVFDEDVVPPLARVAVVGTDGRELAGAPIVKGSVVVVPLGQGRPGSYTVRWRMVAKDDGHSTDGAFSFGVRAMPLPPAPAKGLGVPVAPELFAWLQFLGIVLAGGVLAFRAIVLRPATRAMGEEARDGRIVIGVGVVGAVLALHAGVFSFLAGAYPIVGGGLSGLVNAQIEPIRVGTHLGQAWMVTSFAWFGVLALLVAAWTTPRKRESLLGAAGVLTLGIAFGLSWASHPASRGTLALIADYLHVLAAALWVGGLVSLAIIAASSRSLPSPAREAVARVSILRLSRLAAPAVAIVASAGVYLALRELPAVSDLFTSRYGITLLIKSLIVLGALALGGYHRRFVTNRLVAGAPVASIRRSLSLEMALLFVVLVLAAILSQTAPP